MQNNDNIVITNEEITELDWKTYSEAHASINYVLNCLADELIDTELKNTQVLLEISPLMHASLRDTLSIFDHQSILDLFNFVLNLRCSPMSKIVVNEMNTIDLVTFTLLLDHKTHIILKYSVGALYL